MLLHVIKKDLDDTDVKDDSTKSTILEENLSI